MDADGRYTDENENDPRSLFGVVLIVLITTSGPVVAQEDSSGTADSVDPERAEQIVIVGKRLEAIDLENTARAVEILDLSDMRARATDMGTLLRQAPGVVVRQSGGLGSQAELRLNGLSGRQVPLFVDGLPIELGGLPRNPTLVPVDLVRRVEIFKGVVPIELGADALGGAINFVTYRPRSSSAFAGFEIGSLGTRIFTGDVNIASPRHPFYVSARGFYETSDNSYDVDVNVTDAEGRLEPVTLERFHDGFENYGVSAAVGLRDLAWAHTLELRGFYTAGDNELQHGITMGDRPFGEARSSDQGVGATLRYERFAVANLLDVQISANYTRRQIGFVDLAEVTYNWRGEPVATLETPGEVLLGQGADQTIDEDIAVGRVNLSFEPATGHALALNVSPSWRRRSLVRLEPRGEGEFERQELDPATFIELVSGLAYRSRWLDGRLQNDVFGKLYWLETEASDVVAGFDRGAISQDFFQAGWGDALVWTPVELLRIRASYEFATRLPEPTELLGDGIFVSSNPNLRPEEAHNINLAVSVVGLDAPIGSFDFSVWGFLREVDNLILLEAGEGLSTFSNVSSVRIFGTEGELSFRTWKDRLRLSGVVTWEEGRNTSLEGRFARFADDRIPNRPYLYVTGQAELREQGLFTTFDDARLWSAFRYTHEFFRTFASAGDPETKDVIPSQIAVDVGVVYEWETFLSGAWTLSLAFEVRNLTDAELFDFFAVQRPGRTFFSKVGISFQ
ncbi:MAG: TonB-dependent receptor [Myxococcota bacterium]